MRYGGNFSEIESYRLACVARRALRTREQVDGLVVPILPEGSRGVLHEAHTEEAVARLDGGGEDAHVGQNAAQEDLTHTACAELADERDRTKGASEQSRGEGP